MAKRNKIIRTGTPYNPRKFMSVPTDDAGKEDVELHTDNDRPGEQLLKCEICDVYVTYGEQRARPYIKHRGTRECKKARIKQMQELVQAEANAALEMTGLVPPRVHAPVADPSRQKSPLPPSSPPPPTSPYAAPPSPIEDDNETDALTVVHLSFESTDAPRPRVTFVDSSEHSETDGDDFIPPQRARTPVNATNPCCGQRVRWTPGSIWSTYSFMQHDDENFSWKPIGVGGDDILVVRSKKCRGRLQTEKEKTNHTCVSCNSLQLSRTFESNKQRAKSANPHTPHKYLSMQQMAEIIASNRDDNRRLRSQNTSLRRQVIRLQLKIDDYRRVLMKLASNDIPGASRVLDVALRRGDSTSVILEKLDAAISGVYRPHGNWTDREYAIAFLVKALGGSRLLYTLQKSHHFPSASTLCVQKPFGHILVSQDAPTTHEIDTNLGALLGPRKAILFGVSLMLDGIALEAVARWCLLRNLAMGFCREHSAHQCKQIHSFSDVKRLREALDVKEIHLAKDGAMFVIAPVTSVTNYYPTPTCLFGVCKSETGEMIAATTKLHIERYNLHPDGRAKHGDIMTFCTDGESSFRAARHLLCLTQPAVRGATILKHLVGLNTRVGLDDLIGCCDPKHVIKRFAQALRSYTLKLEIGDMTLTYQDIRFALLASGISSDRVSALLNPQDKQNVPIALDLLKELRNAHIRPGRSASPSDITRVKRVKFYAVLVSYFVRPFTDVNMSLAEQVESLSTYAHLAFGLYRKHRQRFMKGALYSDSMSIVKAVILLIARYQEVDPEIVLYIIHIGTDREEAVFSQVRTQDHARNCDILQLGEKASIGAEINKIYNDYPELYSGHKSRAITNSGAEDHVNPASYPKGVRLDVGSVDLECNYSRGCTRATAIISEELGYAPDFSPLEKPGIDLMRPFEKYVGSSLDKSVGDIVVDAEENDDEDLGANLQHSNASGTPEDDAIQASEPHVMAADDHDDDGFSETEEEVLGSEADVTAVADGEATSTHSKLIDVDGKTMHKSTVIPRYLSSSSSRKVTIRQFRAAGMTIKDILKKTSSFSLTDDPRSSSDATSHLFNKDLAAVLCRCNDGKSVCLVVLEILHFQLGASTSAKIRFDIETKELETPGMRAIGQIVDLENESRNDGAHWTWNGKYLPIAGGQQTVSIPGTGVYPLTPGVHKSADSKHTWIIPASQLDTAAAELWGFLEPTAEEILIHVDALPLVESPRIPYLASGERTLVIKEAAEIMVPKRIGDDEVECLLCGFDCKLKVLRNHVGLHILRAARAADDPLITGNHMIGANPCGWCGREGCKTQLKAQGNGRYSILSDCTYHYQKMSYGHAAKSSGPQPCTNVPIVCSLCLPADAASSKLIPTIWKYNLRYHLAQHHLQPDGSLPPLPPDLMLSSFTSREEESAIGIALSLTLANRKALAMPASEDLRMMEEDMKRARSNSTANTSSRARKRSKND